MDWTLRRVPTVARPPSAPGGSFLAPGWTGVVPFLGSILLPIGRRHFRGGRGSGRCGQVAGDAVRLQSLFEFSPGGGFVLKVLQLIPTLDRSGAEKQMVLLAARAAARPVPGRGGDPDAARAARGRAAGGGSAGHGDRQAVQARPPGAGPAVGFLRAGRFDVVQTWIFAANTYGRVAARLGGGAGGRDGRDGGRPLEEAAASWPSTAAWRDGPTAWWGTRRRWSTSIARSASPPTA